jgi:hypothetical protein
MPLTSVSLVKVSKSSFSLISGARQAKETVRSAREHKAGDLWFP